MVEVANKIDGLPQNVYALLSEQKYELDYYQREYAWERKQITELLDDLESKFSASHEEDHERDAVEAYPGYFLGSIIVSHKGAKRLIVDGQQRLTSLTLLLIHLHHLSQGMAGVAPVTGLIYSAPFGTPSFNLKVPEREPVLKALLGQTPYAAGEASASVITLRARYNDIVDLFPDTLKGKALPYFVDWLLRNVIVIVITAYNDDDAYTIFETMNDRGLPLTPTDMLKGYLLANLGTDEQKAGADAAWKKTVEGLTDSAGKDGPSDLIKAWLRARYATSIRDRKKGALPGDWDVIGTAFHKWLRDHREAVGLSGTQPFADFIHTDFARYARHYAVALHAAQVLMPGWEAVYYNAHNDFTLQYPLMLAPIEVSDSNAIAHRKMQIVADFLDIYTARRLVNSKQIGYSAMSYTMFTLIREIRGLGIDELCVTLTKRLEDLEQSLDGLSHFALNGMNRPQVRYILARLTAYLEAECGVPSSFADYVSRSIKKPFEIEHIWADDYSEFTGVFSTAQEFADYRNRLGGLILLPQGINQSLGAGSYKDKLTAYFGQNLLAKTLSPDCYQKNPSFLAFAARTELPFRAYPDTFDRKAINERQALYRQLAGRIWHPSRLTIGGPQGAEG